MQLEAIAVAIAAGGWKFFKELPEIFFGRNKALREEADFADKFFERLQSDSNLSSFAEEKGYQALAGSRTVTAKEVKLVLSIKSSPQLLRNYVSGKPYIEIGLMSGMPRFNFKKKYISYFSRFVRKIIYFALYMISVLGAISPLFIASWTKDSKALTYLFIISPLALLAAFMAVNEGDNITCAENVIDEQEHQFAGVAN